MCLCKTAKTKQNPFFSLSSPSRIRERGEGRKKGFRKEEEEQKKTGEKLKKENGETQKQKNVFEQWKNQNQIKKTYSNSIIL